MIGRIREQNRLLRALDSTESEFIAVYGRRRVGKTYLIRETFGDSLFFEHSGLAETSMRRQLQSFRSSLREAGFEKCPDLHDWLSAFDALKSLIKTGAEGKKVIFIDEMPWMDTPRSGFLCALEHFWNGWASGRKDIVLIICGSATSWIINNVLRSRGGLHNRVTEEIMLMPFTLSECEEYAEFKHLGYTRRQIAEIYMVFGGVPYYWKFLERGLSPAQNIDQLLFTRGGQLAREYETLYNSLFRNSAPYMSIVRALSKRKIGMNRTEIAIEAQLANSGTLTRYLEELEQCGFIRSYKLLGNHKKGSIFQLIDNYTIFYHSIIVENMINDAHFWSNIQGTPQYYAWAGLAFERLCLWHIDQIRMALQIAGIQSGVFAWRSSKTKPAVQIDLLIDRKDGVINLCEMKFTENAYTLDASENDKLQQRRETLKSETNTRKAIHITLVTAEKLNPSAYLYNVQATVVLDQLFI